MPPEFHQKKSRGTRKLAVRWRNKSQPLYFARIFRRFDAADRAPRNPAASASLPIRVCALDVGCARRFDADSLPLSSQLDAGTVHPFADRRVGIRSDL